MLLFSTLILWGQILHKLSWKNGAELEAVAVPTMGAATAPKALLYESLWESSPWRTHGWQSCPECQCIPGTAGQTLFLLCTASLGREWGEGGSSVLTPRAPCWWSNELYTALSHYCLLCVPALPTVRAASISPCSFLNGDRSCILCSLLVLVGLQFEHCTMIFSKVLLSQGISLLFSFECTSETGHRYCILLTSHSKRIFTSTSGFLTHQVVTETTRRLCSLQYFYPNSSTPLL